MNVAHAPFLFLFNLFFCLRSFFHWLLTWNPIWGQSIAGIYPCHQILTIQSQFSPSRVLHIMHVLLEQSSRCAFSFIWTLVEFARVQSVRGVDLTPRRIIYFKF
ncbi:hypothetical protein C8F04DRAFT_1083967 [Mycena alexandri]|uniref:Uncharacterized protein n=1 Tax=Mycena alexandri TaxID=1745969 RepID=A0AAD6T5I7_9AGAR|nr:hypothetical protein C8F04DRAFT_1083967 [Mycena alexandri]